MGGMVGPVLRMLVSLGIVLGLMYIAARLLRRSQGGSPTRGPRVRTARGPLATRLGNVGALAGLAGRRATRSARPRKRLEVLARQPLGKTASVAVVRVAGRTLLVGVTDTAVQLLSEVDANAFEDAEQPAGPAALTIPDAEISALLGTPNALAPAEPALAGAYPAASSVLDLLRERTVRRG